MAFRLSAVAPPATKSELSPEFKALSAAVHQLNPGQLRVFTEVTAAIRTASDTGGVPKLFVVTGGGGTGKTFVQRALTLWCENYFHNPSAALQFAAPTYKAASVMRQNLYKAGAQDYEIHTLAKLLGLRKSYDREGNKVFLPDKDPAKRTHIKRETRVIMVDEASLISSNQLYLLDDWVDRRPTKFNRYPRVYPQVVFVFFGDPQQLPPVEDGELCELFTNPHTAKTFHLTEVMRHSGPILSLAQAVVEKPGKLPNFNSFHHVDDDQPSKVHALDRMVWFERWKELLLKQKDDPTKFDVQCIAFRNDVVAQLNAIGRDHVFGPGAKAFQIGERLAAIEPVKDPVDDLILAGTGTELVVLTVDWESEDVHGQTFKIATIKAIVPADRDRDGIAREIVFQTLDPNDRERFDALKDKARTQGRALETLKRKAEREKAPWTKLQEEDRRAAWRKFFFLDELYAKVDPAYCITCHKSQGSAYGIVFVDMLDVLTAPGATEFKQCLAYVGVTRATKELYLSRT